MQRITVLLALTLISCVENPPDVTVAVSSPLEMEPFNLVRHERMLTCFQESRFRAIDPSKESVAVTTTVVVEEQKPLNELDIDDVVTRLQGVTTVPFSGKYYDCMTQPDYEAAQRVLDGYVPADTEPVGSKETTTVTKDCCDNDNRVQSFIFDYYARISVGEQGATLAWIGRHTAVTAAHVHYDTETNTWLKVTRSGSPDWPWYRRETSINDSTPQVRSCYAPWLNPSWMTASSNGTYNEDYMVLDFRYESDGETECDNSSDPTTSWFGTSIRSDSQITSGDGGYARIGYPAYYNNTGGNINSAATLLYSFGAYGKVVDGVPFMHYSVYQAPYTNSIWDFNDATQGDSGSPLIWDDNGLEKLISVHHGNTSDDDDNIERRWNTAFYNFVDSHSLFPNDN